MLCLTLYIYELFMASSYRGSYVKILNFLKSDKMLQQGQKCHLRHVLNFFARVKKGRQTSAHAK
jgi:hypothetical protein